MAKIEVVTAALIELKGLYLITQREKGKFRGLYEFPGGQVEFGESPEECLKREICEELGINIKDLKIFEVSSAMVEEDKEIILIGYLCRPCSTNIKKDVHYAWVTAEQMAEYQFCEADIKFVKKLQQKEAVS